MFEDRFPSRIHIVGTSGAGKTTLARDLAAALGYAHIELDALNWEPNWTEASTEVLRARVERATRAPTWVADGNYGRARALLWADRPTVIWLDYSYPLVMTRVVSRTARRVFRREVLWNGNRERLRKTLSRDSIILWAAKTYHRRRREYPPLFAQHPDIPVLRLRKPAEAEALLRAARRWKTTSAPPLDVAAPAG